MFTTNRHRVQEFGPHPGAYVQTVNGSPYLTVGTIDVYRKKTIDDVNTPDFWTRLRRGEVINNPCTIEVFDQNAGKVSEAFYRAENTSGSTLYEGTGNVTGGLGTLYPPPGFQTISEIPDKLDLVDKAKFLALQRMDMTPYHFGEDAAELHKTIRFLRNPFKELFSLSKQFRNQYTNTYKRLKNKNLRRRRQNFVVSKNKFQNQKVYKPVSLAYLSSQALANTWLQYRFAMMPIVLGIENGLAAWYNEQPQRPRQTARGIVKGDDGLGNLTLAGGPFTYESTDELSYDIQAGILYVISNPFDDARTKLGFRAKAIPETLWAVTPYSWLVDRVVNITGAIKAVSNLADPSLEIEAAWVRTKQSSKRTDLVVSQSSATYNVTLKGNRIETSRFLYTRTPWEPTWSDAIPKPDISGLVDDLSKTSDLLALIRQNIRP